LDRETEEKEKSITKNGKLLFWSLDFSLNLKQEVGSPLLDFQPLSIFYFLHYDSIAEAGSQCMLICIIIITILGDDFAGQTDQIEDNLYCLAAYIKEMMFL
jgi:hypothetical protein